MTELGILPTPENRPPLTASWQWMTEAECEAMRARINRAMVFGLPADVLLYHTNEPGLPIENSSQLAMLVGKVEYRFVICGWRPRVTFDAETLHDAAWDLDQLAYGVDDAAKGLRTPRGINRKRVAAHKRLLNTGKLMHEEMRRIIDACRDPRCWARPILPRHDIVGVVRRSRLVRK